MKSIKKVLIANRGEIACRIIKTLKKMGIKSVAVYSEADANALHVKLADLAIFIGPSPASKSYLVVDKIISAARSAGADAIHPGYGFLSENPLLAESCANNDIIFIGPTPASIRAMGSKSEAKRIMEKSGVPLIPGYHGENQDEGELRNQAEKIGFPVIVKAALGGGGKGMRVVHQINEFDNALASCKREAKSSFNDDSMLIEKYIGQPRHVEIQIFSDTHGNVVHLFERDCSIQRRHQKIVEEAPAPNIPDDIRNDMAQAAIQAAKAINYVGAGTVEFLYDGISQYYFMEMNTRLQVEHPVTEMITGIDLVEWQILVAEGKTLPKKQQEISKNGHSIEVRLCAEDCNNNFIPAIGSIFLSNTPEQNESVRFDHGMNEADDISIYYDPMFAKLIVHGNDRATAIKKMGMALRETFVAGVHNNIKYLTHIIENNHFGTANISTHFLTDQDIALQSQNENSTTEAAICFAIFKFLNSTHAACNDRRADLTGWRLNSGARIALDLIIDGTSRNIEISRSGGLYIAQIESQNYTVKALLSSNRLTLSGDVNTVAVVFNNNDKIQLFLDGQRFEIEVKNAEQGTHGADDNDKHCSPMPGIITKIYINKGQNVSKGDPLFVVEAMKMEHVVYANKEGNVKELIIYIGDKVIPGANLVEIE